MKTKLLSLAFATAMVFASAQTTLLQEGFDDITTLSGSGWTMTNQSTPVGSKDWFQGNPTVFSSQAGSPTSYIAANFNSTAGAGTISNWLITPNLNLENGDVIKFWTNSPSNSFPDNLQVILSTGATPTIPSGGATDLGSFTAAPLLEIDATLAGTYPTTWTEFSITLSGLPAGGTPANIAFRYYVTDGGPSGTNSNYIGIDTFSVVRPGMGVSDLNKNSLSIYPNPATDYIKVNTTEKISSVQIFDVSGRSAKTAMDNNQIDVRSLKPGVYVIQVKIGDSTINKKFIKK